MPKARLRQFANITPLLHFLAIRLLSPRARLEEAIMLLSFSIMTINFFKVTKHLILWDDGEKKPIIINILVGVILLKVDSLHL